MGIIIKRIGSYLFIFFAPILFGMFLPLILGMWIDRDIAAFLFMVYAIAWVAVWHGPLNQGEKLTL